MGHARRLLAVSISGLLLVLPACSDDGGEPVASASPSVSPSVSPPASPASSPALSPVPTLPFAEPTTEDLSLLALDALLRPGDVPATSAGETYAEISRSSRPPTSPSLRTETCSRWQASASSQGTAVEPPEPDAVARAYVYGTIDRGDGTYVEIVEDVLVYEDAAAASAAVTRHRRFATDCRTTLDYLAEFVERDVTVGGSVPTGYEGFRVTQRSWHPGGTPADAEREHSAVVSAGRSVAFVAIRRDSPANPLDMGWLDRVIAAAAVRLSGR